MERIAYGSDGQRLVDTEVSSGDRTYALFIHLVFILVPVPLVPQLVMWLIRRDESPFIDDHGKEAVNFQVSLMLIAAMAGVLVIFGIGLLVLFALPFFGIVCTVIGAIAAGRGEYFRYPICIRLIQ